MSEATKFIDYINKANSQVKVIDKTSNNELSKLIVDEFWDNIDQFERPDVLIKMSNKTLLLEHFEFNSSKLIRGSSLEHKSIAELDRELDKKSLTNKDEPIVISKELENQASTSSYISNLLRNANKHIEKYDDYIENFNDKKKDTYSSNFEFGFIIENTSSIYDMVWKDNMPTLILPFNIKEFLDFLASNKKIKHVFYLSKTPKEHVIYYFYNSKESLDELAVIVGFVTEEDKLMFSNPQSISARMHF